MQGSNSNITLPQVGVCVFPHFIPLISFSVPPQGGYYPQQPPQSYPGPGYGQPPYGGPGYQPQPPPQTVYVCVGSISEFPSDSFFFVDNNPHREVVAVTAVLPVWLERVFAAALKVCAPDWFRITLADNVYRGTL